MWNFDEKQMSPLMAWNKMALSSAPNVSGGLKETTSPNQSDDSPPPKSARPREGTVHESIGKKPKV